MTLEQVQERKKALQADLEGHQTKGRAAAAVINEKQQELNLCNAMIQAVNGAMQDCDFWIARLMPVQAAPEGIGELKTQ